MQQYLLDKQEPSLGSKSGYQARGKYHGFIIVGKCMARAQCLLLLCAVEVMIGLEVQAHVRQAVMLVLCV